MDTAAKEPDVGPSAESQVQDLPDEAVVRRIISGNVQAFEILIRRYNQRLYRLARGILSDDQDARDAVQESYVKAFLGLDGFRGPDGFATWLYVITRNQAFSMLRQRQREMPMEMQTMEHMMDEASLLDTPDPAAALEIERLGITLQTAIDRLPDAFRIVFVLRIVEGMSVSDTAQILGLNEKTVKTRLFRARRMLRKRFKGYLQGASAHVYEFAGRRCDVLTAAVMARVAGLGAGFRETST